MRVQGSLQAPLPQPLKRRKQLAKDSGQEPVAKPELIRWVEDADFIAADETPDWDAAQLSASARKALQGYWAVAHQGHLWAERRRVDVYV